MHDLIVVGAGFWGAAVAWHARAAGLNTLVIDDAAPMSGSRNAAGLVREAWMKPPLAPRWWGMFDWEYSRDWLTEVAGLQLRTERFATWRRPEWRERRGLYLVPDPTTVLACAWPVYVGKVVGLEAGGDRDWLVRSQDGSSWRAPRLVLAAGTETDTLLFLAGLAPTGVRGFRGRALLGATSRMPEQPETFLVRPYVAYTARAWPGALLRCGDTMERPGADGLAACKALSAYVREHYPDFQALRWLDGQRPTCPDGPIVERVAPGCIVATGGGRVGLALAAPVARRTLQLLEA